MRLKVIDWDEFREIVAEIVADRGTQEAAAKALDIKQPHVSRLLNPTYRSDTVSYSMLDRIQKALVKHKSWSVTEKFHAVDQLWGAVMSPKADAVYYDKYLAWLHGTALRSFDERRCERLLKKLGQEYPKLMGPLDRYWGQGMGEHRITLAKYRIVEPLLASEATGGVERSIAELREAGELGVYLRAAVKREELLLKRESDHERAQKIAAQQTSTKVGRRTEGYC